MKKRTRDFVDYVFLSELDSVRTSTHEQIEGEKALFRTLVYEGKAVVLTYNQVVDSITFLHCIRNKEAFDILLNFFKDKRLLINQYRDDMNLSKYILDNYTPESTFKSSYFHFLNEYNTKHKDIIFQGLIDSIKYGDDIFLKKVMPAEIKPEHQQEIYSYIKFMLTINSYMYDYGCYVKPRAPEELIGHHINDYMEKIYNFLLELNNENAENLKLIIETHKNKNRKNTRSQYYQTAEEVIQLEKLDILKKYIDVAYNQTLEYSIPIINRSDHLKEDVLKVILSTNTNENNQLANIEKNWKSGYRITSITSYIFYRIKNIKWKYLLLSCPFVEIFRIISTLLLSFVLMIVFNFFSGIERLWISSSIAIVFTFLYNYCTDLLEDIFVQKLPDWCTISAFVQFKHFLKDIQILLENGK